jgi:hypothetical protein
LLAAGPDGGIGAVQALPQSHATLGRALASVIELMERWLPEGVDGPRTYEELCEDLRAYGRFQPK